MKKNIILSLACVSFLLPSCGDDDKDKKEEDEKIESVCDCVDLMTKHLKNKTKASISSSQKCGEFFQDAEGISKMQDCENYEEYMEVMMEMQKGG